MIIDRKSPVPQYFQLQTWLIGRIEQGIFKPSDKIPTEEELVRMTGLARATIRQAVQNLVNMGYLMRRRGLGTFVLEHNVNTGRKEMIGVLVPDIRTGYTPELARGAEDEAVRDRLMMILSNTDDLPSRAEANSRRLIEQGVSGVVFVPTSGTDRRNRNIVEIYEKNHIPVVLADRQISGSNMDLVTTDNLEGGYRITRYLIAHGHKKIAIILSALFSTERLRLEGYRKALSEEDIPVNGDWIYSSDKPFDEVHYREIASRVLSDKKRPTAIFASHDRIAFLILEVAKEKGIAIPGDLSIAGYDDLPFARSHPTGLTTMHQPIYEMGRESVKLLLSRLRDSEEPPSQIVLKSELIERDTVRHL